MAPPGGGHLLVTKTMRLLRLGVDKASRVLRDKLPQAVQVEARHQPAYAHIKQPSVNRLAAIRQGQRRSYSTQRFVETAVRYFTNTSKASARPLKSSYPQSRTRTVISQITSRTPFASTLRPNLTGGALGRSAGGYGTGAGRVHGARYFSHGPAAPAEIVQNVSQAVRAFWLSGQKARFDGNNPRTGDKRFRAVSTLQDRTRNIMDMNNAHAAGSFIDFKVSPTITAVGPLSNVPRSSVYTSTCDAKQEMATINNPEVISTLAVDFARALKDLAAVMNDLKRLATLGELPLELANSTTLRVRFPGCDADTVESLCRELNIRRGIVGQDDDFDTRHGVEMALLFPFAPSKPASETAGDHEYRPAKRHKRDHIDWHGMISPARTASPDSSHHSMSLHDFEEDIVNPVGFMKDDGEIVDNPWLSSPSGYSSLQPSDGGNDDMALFFAPTQVQYSSSKRALSATPPSNDYEGLEGIYKFIEQCDRARR